MSRIPARFSKRTIAIFVSSLWFIVFGLAMVVYVILHIKINFSQTPEDVTRSSRVNAATLFFLGVGGTLMAAPLFSMMIDNAKRIGRS